MEDFKEGDRVVLVKDLSELGEPYVSAYEDKQILTVTYADGTNVGCRNEWGDAFDFYENEIEKHESKIQSKIKTKYKI